MGCCVGDGPLRGWATFDSPLVLAFVEAWPAFGAVFEAFLAAEDREVHDAVGAELGFHATAAGPVGLVDSAFVVAYVAGVEAEASAVEQRRGALC